MSREFDWIARHFAPLAGAEGLGLADDAAVLGATVVSCDTSVEGVHFPPGLAPAAIARRALRVALSDLAAMGAQPTGHLVALSLPGGADGAWVAGFAAGLAEDNGRYGSYLIGGDTTRTPGPLSITVSVLGNAPQAGILARSGARAGDSILVSDPVGHAAAGLAALKEKRDDPDIKEFLLPEPRIYLGRAAAGVARAAIDVSDGLVADLGHIARASGLRAVLNLAAVPTRPALDPLKAITAGDDYVLALAVPPEKIQELQAFALHDIGTFTQGPPGVEVLGPDGQPIALARAGWQHF